MRFRSLLATTVLLFALPALAGDKPALVTKVFSVADLVTPIPDFAVPDYAPKPDARATKPAAADWKQPTLAESSAHLVRLVRATASPSSWEIAGGRGKVEFFDIGSSLVVTNTAEVVAEVAALLDSLRHMQDACVGFEVRVVKVPAGFCARVGVPLTGDTVLTDREVRLLLEAVQGYRDATITQFPKLTTFDGQVATVGIDNSQYFVTSLEAVKVKGDTVLITKQVPTFLGDKLTICGRLTADEKSVSVRASMTRVALVGKVDLVPVVTQITPVFEGGSQGKPVPLTRYLQAPEFKTDKVEKAAVVPDGSTLVLGGWKERAEAKGKKPAAEYEVVVLATVRVIKPEAAVFKLRNVGAADAVAAVHKYAAENKLNAIVTAEARSNSVLVSAAPNVAKRLGDVLIALDREPEQVVCQAMIVEVPHGFAARAGLTADGTSTLTPRELTMLTELIRAAKMRDECDVLSRPQIQVADGQTAHVEVGQNYLAGSGFNIRPVVLGLKMTLTPNITADAKSLKMSTKVQLGSFVWRGEGQVFQAHELRSDASVAFGHTLVLGRTSTVESRSDNGGVIEVARKQIETLVIITPHRVRGEADQARVLADEAKRLKWCLPDVQPAGWFTK